MPLDPSIPLAVKPFEAPNGLQTIGQLMNLRNAGQEYLLRQAQMEQAKQQTADIQAQAQQRNRDLADQNTIQEAMRDPDAAVAFHTGDFSKLDGKIQPKTLDVLRANQAALQEKAMANTQAQNSLRSAAFTDIAETTQGLAGLVGKNPDGTPDLSRVNQELPNAIARLNASGAFKNAGISVPTIQQITDPQQLDTILGGARGSAAFHANVAELQKTQAATAASTAAAGESSAKAAESTAKAEQTKVETGIKQHQLDAMRGLPPVGDPKRYAAVDAQATDPDLQKGARAAYDGMIAAGELPAEALKAVAPFAEKQNQRNTDKDPAIRAARIADAVKTEIAKQAGLTANSPDAFAGIIDPTAREKARADYVKASQDYADRIGAAEQSNALIAQAQSGNKAAPGLVPIGELKLFVNRVNSQELKGLSSAAGDAYDRVQGFVSKYTEGEPIPASILKDMGTVNSTVMQAAEHVYQNKVQINRQAYGSKAQPIQLPQAGAASSAPAFKAGDTRVINGVTYQRDAAGQWHPQ